MTMTQRAQRSLALWFLFLTTTIAYGQVAGTISGTVVDQTGSVVAGATVAVTIAGGTTPVASVQTNDEGMFALPGLQPVTYDLSVEKQGFAKFVMRALKLDPGASLSLGRVVLEVSALSEMVEVTAQAMTVQTTTAEVSQTVTNSQFARLPQLNRSPLALLSTQAGIGYSGRGATTINGLRVTYNNVTVDGINVQDNFIRTNALDFLPNLLLLDQIAEVTISTANSTTASGGGATQVSFVTPSGTNQYHGSVYWFNRNNKFAANSWFNNRDKIARPYLNQNQVGFSLGGPVLKDKLLFYTNYEAFRLRQSQTSQRTILTNDARNGIFTYVDSGGVVRKTNILQLMGKSIDPVISDLLKQVPTGDKINNFRVGDSTDALLRNTGGYSFLQRRNRTRDNMTAKLDYYFSSKHSFAGTYMWNRDINDRPDVSATTYLYEPQVANDGSFNMLSLAWRWVPTANMTNELRGGMNIAPAIFQTYDKKPDFFVGNTVFSNPINTFMLQGRDVETYNLNNTTSWIRGKHNVQFGYQGQYMRIRPYNYAGIVPTYNVGIGTGQQGLVASQLPGISSSDLTAANNLLATLAGLQNTMTQTFNVKDRTSGFVGGVPDDRNFTFDMHGFFLQDTWKATRKLTLVGGLRYDYFTVVDEKNALALLPVVQGNAIATLLSNYTLDWAGKAVNRPFYTADRNNFAPNVGMAYDVFGDGSLALRAGYSIKYVNDSHVQTIRNNVNTNAGLSQTVTVSALSGTISQNRAPVPSPTFKVPRTAADNFALNRGQAAGLPDPDLATPYVQQWNFNIQKRVWGGVFEARYVGNKMTKAFRAFDFNQIDVTVNGFLDDFIRARNNGFLAQSATGAFNPAYNPSIPGSQPLNVFAQLPSGGLLTNATVRSYIQTGQVGELAAVYVNSNLHGNFNFYPNMLGLGMNMVTNYSNGAYHGLQLDYTRRYTRGLLFQINYAYGKVMSDAAGDGQTNFEAFLDMKNPKLEKSRTPYDITHALKSNFSYELPLGAGKRFLNHGGVVDRIVGGWSINGILTVQSGNPISILSERATLNRAARSTGQNGTTATALVNKDAIEATMGVRMTGSGPYYFAASVTGPDGRAVAGDGLPNFSGQIFANPGPGTLGGLQRRMFNGPSWYNIDLGIMKYTRITERVAAELRGEAINAFNTVAWYIGDQTINSTTFGVITDTQTAPRRIQFGLYLRF